MESGFADFGIEVLREARIESVDADAHALTIASGRPQVIEDVAFAHAVPHYRAPRWIADSGLAAHPAPGLVDIDPETLRHRRHASIWAIGDAADARPGPPAGRCAQVDVLAQNMPPPGAGHLKRYDGYTVVPITEVFSLGLMA